MPRMSSPVYEISVWIMQYFTFLLLVLSLLFCFRKYNPAYMKTFPIYCFGNAVAETVPLVHPLPLQLRDIVFTIFELLYLTYFLSRVIRATKVRKLILALDGGFLLLSSIVITNKTNIGAGSLPL